MMINKMNCFFIYESQYKVLGLLSSSMGKKKTYLLENVFSVSVQNLRNSSFDSAHCRESADGKHEPAKYSTCVEHSARLSSNISKSTFGNTVTAYKIQKSSCNAAY